MKELETSLKVLEGVKRKFNKDSFCKNKPIQDIAKWNFYVVIQSCLDIGNHIIAEKNYRTPESYVEILEILKEEKIINEAMRNSLSGMAGFRNRLAHGYFRIEPNKIYTYLKHIQDIKKYLKIIREIIKI